MLLLRALGALDLLAILAVFMPTPLMAGIHEALGMGQFPQTAVVDYLARSAAVLYAVHGALIFFLSFDVRRYRKLIRFLAFCAIAQGFVMLGINVHAGMPRVWTLVEAVFYFVPAVVVLWLLDRSLREQPVAPR
jgi:hypothetical protein